MGITALFLAAIGAVAAWWLSRQRLTAKPWLEEGAVGEVPGTGASTMAPAKIALGVFLAVVGSLFALLFSAYAMRSQMGDWAPLPAPRILWLNTGFLVLSSVALQGAVMAARRRRTEAARAALLAGGAATLAFLVGQVLAWRQLAASGYLPAASPAIGFFYLITAVHGLHVLGGLAALGRAAAKSWPDPDLGRARPSLELCAVYWHVLLLIWVFMFVRMSLI